MLLSSVSKFCRSAARIIVDALDEKMEEEA